MRKWLGFGLLALLLVAAVAAPGLLRQGSPPAGTGEIRWPPWLPVLMRRDVPSPIVRGPAEPPVPEVEADGQSVPAVRGSFCWTRGDSGLCADSIPPPALVAATAAPVVAPGSMVKVRFPLAPNTGSLGVNLWRASGAEAVDLSADGRFQVQSEPGRYVYEVHARWPQGDASYAFAIEVKGEVGPHPPAITVRVAGVAVLSVEGAYCWSDGQQGLCTDTLSPAEQLAKVTPPVVDGGAPVEISFAIPPQSGSIQVHLVKNQAMELVATDGSFRLPTAPGRYIYQVDARWPQGSSSYGFQVEVR